jgi:hypothetical protein
MMQAMAAVELCLAQRLVAHHFAVAYLKLEDMQDVARQVIVYLNKLGRIFFCKQTGNLP